MARPMPLFAPVTAAMREKWRGEGAGGGFLVPLTLNEGFWQGGLSIFD